MTQRHPSQNGVLTFLGAPTDYLKTGGPPMFGFMGLQYDCSTTNRTGAREGPRAVRAASRMLTDGVHPMFGSDPAAVTRDWDDVPINHVEQSKALEDIEAAIFRLTNAKQYPLLVGGDHSVTLGVLRALKRVHKVPLNVIHFDAHCDTWGGHFDDPAGHGTWVRDAIESNIINPAKIVQIGIRSPVDRETARWLPGRGGLVISAREAMREDISWMLDEISKRLPPDEKTYITFDIDALDPAYAPGTGTPEVGGLTTMWALEMVEVLAGWNTVGMDVVEVLPARDVSEITALAAATLLWTHASGIAAAKQEATDL